MHYKLWIPGLAFTALLGGACGGAQRGGGDTVWFASAAELVPADVAWAYVADPDARAGQDAVAAMDQFSSFATPQNLPPGIRELAEATGLDLTGDVYAQVGVDPAGEWAAFSSGALPVVVARLSDPQAFADTVSRILDANPDAEVESVEYARHPFQRVDVGPISIDVGVIGHWGIVRVANGDAVAGYSDEAFAALLTRAPEASILAAPELAAVASRAGGAPLMTYGVMRSTPLAAGVESLLLGLSDDREDLQAMGVTGLATGYRSADEEERCVAAAERLTTALPWAAFAGLRDPADPSVVRSWAQLHLGMAAAERAAEVIHPLAGDLLAEGSDAAIYLASGVDFLRLVLESTSDPTLSRCPNAGAILGAIGEIRRMGGSGLTRASQMADGRGALALYSVRFAGFLPFVDAAVAVGSPNPALLAEPVQRELEQNGAVGTVDATAAVTTIRYDLMHLDLTMLLGDDSVALGVGDVPQRVLNGFVAPAGAYDDSGAPFGMMSVSGPAFVAILQTVRDWAAQGEMLPAEAAQSVDNLIAGYSKIDWVRMDATLEGSDIVLSTSARMLGQ